MGKSNYLTPTQLHAILDRSSAMKVLVFGQCFSGVLGRHVPQNSVVCRACAAHESSYPRSAPVKGMEPEYDEFLYHFASVFRGECPDGRPLDQQADLPATNQVTIDAAFRYARDLDRWYVTAHENPCIFDPHGLARTIGL